MLLKYRKKDNLDLEIASKRWKEIEEGKFSKSNEKEFLKELENW